MFFNFLKKNVPSKEEVAKILKTSPEALEAFEKAYAAEELPSDTDDLFSTNAKDAAAMKEGLLNACPQHIISRIVQELVGQTVAWVFDGKKAYVRDGVAETNPVTKEELLKIPESERPQLTGRMVIEHIDEPSSHMLLYQYELYLKEKNPQKKRQLYGMFRQGMDILDLDPVLYEMLGMNWNSMGHWLPRIAESVVESGFFRIPATTIIKVPLPMLQLTRMDYGMLNRTTLDIVDEYCRQVFDLNLDREYFIKTGIYSSKYDFRNARVTGAKEVRELGEYLLFIQNQASMMAGPLATPSIYGAATTNEWAVREYIPDKENNPCIYHGLPLHTEYRLFVDFDAPGGEKRVIGMTPYWEPETMKKRFGEGAEKKDSHMFHDYAIYSAYEETLMGRYMQNKDRVWNEMEKLVQNVSDLHGQWSVDVMQNGDDFWFIDMGVAQNSAFYNCVPEQLRRPLQEKWIPELKREYFQDTN